MYTIHLSLLSGPPMWERPATAVPSSCWTRSSFSTQKFAGAHPRGDIQIRGTHSEGTVDYQGAAAPEAEGRVWGVRVEPGGGGATMRRSVESGRAICGVRVWSRGARGGGDKP